MLRNPLYLPNTWLTHRRKAPGPKPVSILPSELSTILTLYRLVAPSLLLNTRVEDDVGTAWCLPSLKALQSVIERWEAAYQQPDLHFPASENYKIQGQDADAENDGRARNDDCAIFSFLQVLGESIVYASQSFHHPPTLVQQQTISIHCCNYSILRLLDREMLVLVHSLPPFTYAQQVLLFQIGTFNGTLFQLGRSFIYRIWVFCLFETLCPIDVTRFDKVRVCLMRMYWPLYI